MTPRQTAAAQNNDDLREQLQTLLGRLDKMQDEIDTLRAQIRTVTPASVKEPSVSKPETFSGSEDLSLFLQQCELSFDLQPSRFPTDFHKVGFILSYLRGPAAHWARPYLMNKAHELRNDLPKFTHAIEQAYGDPTRRFRATIELRALKQTTTVARYSAEFQAIASHLSWNDDALCSQFYEGLVDGIKNEIAKNPPANLHEFISAATRLESQGVQRPSKILEPPRPPSLSTSPSPSTSSSSSKYPHLKLDDAERARCYAERLCFRCRQPGHKREDCPSQDKDNGEKEPTTVSFMNGGTPSFPGSLPSFPGNTPSYPKLDLRYKYTPLVKHA
jgi:Ty3 transposon capsid-like protein/Zinc knuckle